MRWRSVVGHAAALVTALTIAGFAFVFRFNTLGGTLGGFEDDHFPVLARAEMLLHGEQPLRDFADAEFRGAWPALSYEVPALTQKLLGRNLLSEARVTVGVLAACAGIVFLVARSLSGRWLVALLASLTVLVSGAELYNFPKVLALTVAAPLLMWLLKHSSTVRIAAIALWTAIAGLFRHDYAVYLAVVTTIGLLVRGVGAPRLALRHSAVFIAFLALWLAPSAIWVQRYEGIPQYITSALNVSRIERATRSLQDWPVMRMSFPLDEPSLIALLYYAFWAVPLCAFVLLVVERVRRGPSDATARASQTTAVGFAFVALALVVNYFFLRSNLESRFGDAVVPIVLIAAWIAGASQWASSRVARTTAWLAPSLVLATLFVAMFQVNAVASELRTAGISQSWQEMVRRYTDIRNGLEKLPPSAWTDANAHGVLAPARYVAECSGPDDYVFVGAYASEIPVYAHRRFAAGQGTFALGLYSSPADQEKAIDHFGRQSVPIALAGPEFSSDYPLVSRYLESRYREVGTFDLDGATSLRVLVDKSRTHVGTHPATGFPCFR